MSAAMWSRRGFTNIALIFALLIAQQGGFAHALSHLHQKSPLHDTQVPQGKACSACGLFAQAGNGAVGTAAIVAPLGRSAGAMPHLEQGFQPSPLRRFLSRAPPVWF